MNLPTFTIVWPIFITVNVLLLSSVLYIALDTAIYAITRDANDISYIESLAIAVTILALRGAFNIELESEH